MVYYPTILNLPQEDINRQLYEMIQKANAGDTSAIEALQSAVSDIEDAIGDESTADSILGRIKALETKTKDL